MIEKIKNYLETINVTPTSWILGVSGVLMVRFFLESLSNPTSSGFFASDSSTLLHYYLFFMSGFIMLLLFFRFAVPSWKAVIPQFIAVSSLLILLPPIIDWSVSAGGGMKMTYFFDTPRGMIYSLLHFGAVGTTAGLRVEIALALICLGALVYFVESSWKKAAIAPIALYLIILIFASLPGIISFFGQVDSVLKVEPIVFLGNSIGSSQTLANNLHGTLQYSSVTRFFEISFNFIMGKVLFLISTTLGLIWFYLSFRGKFMAMLWNSRVERVAHYIFTLFFGMFVAYVMFPALNLNWTDWLSVFVLCLAFYFSCMFAICVNDLADEDTDRISAPNRPLIAGTLTREDMKQIGAVFLLSSFVAGFLAGYLSFFFILAFTALYYIYSAPPTRFKLIPLFSSFIISLCYLATALAGFFLVFPIKQVSSFPAKIIVAIILIITLLSNARDMKDIEGDKATGIKTTLLLFGEFWGPKVVGIFAAVSFVLVPIFSKIYILFISAVPSALLSFYFINKKPYFEKPLVWTYFLFVLASILLFLI